MPTAGDSAEDEEEISDDSQVGHDGTNATASGERLLGEAEDVLHSIFRDQPSWIAGLEDQDPGMFPSLFPYHIPTGFSLPPQGRRLSGSTILTATTEPLDQSNSTGYNNQRIEKKKREKLTKQMDDLHIRFFLQRLHQSQLKRPRPSAKTVLRDQAVKWNPREAEHTHQQKSEMEDLQGRIQKIKQENAGTDCKSLIALYKRLFSLSLGLKDTRTAQAAFSDILELRKGRNVEAARQDNENDAYSLLLLGKVQNDLGDFTRAFSNFEKALGIILSMSDDEGRVQYDGKSLDGLQETLSSDSNTAGLEPIDVGNAIYLMGNALLSCGNKSQAMELLQEAHRIFQGCKSFGNVSETMRDIGVIYCSWGKYDTAISFYEECLAYGMDGGGRDDGNELLVSDTLAAMGDCFGQQEQKERSLDCYEQCLATRREILGDNHELVTDALVALGDLFCCGSEGFEERRALSYFQQIPPVQSSPFRVHILEKEAILQFQLGETSSALNKFQELIQMRKDAELEQTVNDTTYFNALISSGVCYYAAGNREKAKSYYKRASGIYAKSQLASENPREASILAFSEAAVRKTRLAKAMDEFKLAMRIRDKWHDGNVAKSEGSSSQTVNWYYYLRDDRRGWPDGWYKFDAQVMEETECLYQTHVVEKKSKWLSFREQSKHVLVSESSGFAYEIDFRKMTQTNAVSGTIRPVARTEDGRPPSDVPS